LFCQHAQSTYLGLQPNNKILSHENIVQFTFWIVWEKPKEGGSKILPPSKDQQPLVQHYAAEISQKND
jgi:hypothetical protein